jgi:RecA-family ATPase
MANDYNEAELALIGALIIRPALLEESPPIVREPGILSPLARSIYETIVETYDHCETVDAVILHGAMSPELSKQALPFIAAAMESCPLPANARHYAGVLERKARRSEINNLAAALQEAVKEGDSPARLQEHVEGLASLVEDDAEPGGHKLEYLDLANVMDEEPEPVPWLIPGWLAQRDCAMIAGEPGSGKSTFAVDMALAIATGGEFLGTLKVPEQHRVLYLDEEMPERMARRRLRQLITGRELEPDQVSMRYFNRQRINLDRPESRLALRHVIEEYEPGVVVLDSLVRFHSRDENSNSEMSEFYDMLVELGEEYLLTWILLHHLAKPSKDKSKQLGHRVRGASDLRAAMDQLYGLEGDSATSMRTLIHDKNRWGTPSLTMSMVYQESDDGLSATLMGNSQTKNAANLIIDLLVDAAADGVMRQDLVSNLDSAGYDAASRVATTVLGKLHGQGTIVKRKELGGRVRFWHKDSTPARLPMEEE